MPIRKLLETLLEALLEIFLPPLELRVLRHSETDTFNMLTNI